MRHIIIFFISIAPLFATSQSTAPHFEKKAIGKSGAYAYLPGQVEDVDLSYSPDSSKVYTIGSTIKDYRFDVIFVALSTPAQSDEDVSPLLEAYMDYLKGALEVTSSAGYGKGRTLSTHPAAKGMIDYWKDKDKNEMTVTGWADKKYIAVLVITGPEQYPQVSVADVFFKGFRFPGD